MLKLNASYSKKVPADQEYSSQQYHASVEQELSDSLKPEELRQRIRDTFELVRQSVETELNVLRADLWSDVVALLCRIGIVESSVDTMGMR